MSMIGKSLAHYEVTAEIGKGGMGEVYQAKDQKLGRDVAIKVLPEEFAKDADRVARFQREAKLLASLNHPNIAAIHGLEESNGTHFLVLELVEGDTLSDRIKAGPIPVEEALKLALQIAEALEAAHEKGVIHRDLKPSNIKVTPEGKVKVLDFGLAKAFAGDQENMILSDSPTISAAATQKGVILGTAAYMSPEQAKGKAVDKRTDIWAFGAVLYEMLTGKAAFQGDDVTEILASVVKASVNLDLLPKNVHPRVCEVITRCLQKEQKRRYSGIGDVQYEIEQVLSDPKGIFAQPAAAVERRSGLRTTLPWIAAIILVGVIVGLAVWQFRAPGLPQVMRFEYYLPEGLQLSTSGTPLAVSPDGKQFVYSTTQGLYLRSVEELTAKLVAGTEGNTQQPFFSPDGKSIGYFAVNDRQLKKIGISGGAPVTLCSVMQPLGAWWNADDTIIYGQYPVSPIMRVSANGGTPEALIQPEAGLSIFPQVLPDGKSVLYTSSFSANQGRIMVQQFKSGEPKELFPGSMARYLPTGHIIYRLPNDNNLYAVAFDIDRLEVTGGHVPIVEGMVVGAVSEAGTLAYIPGTSSSGASGNERTLVWVDREGNEESLGAPPNDYGYPKISPEGTRVALTVGGDNDDIKIWDTLRKTLSRLTFDEAADLQSIWTPDGDRIVFASRREGPLTSIYWKKADGTGTTEKLGSMPDQGLMPWCWSRDGKTLIVAETDGGTQWDIGMLSMEGDHTEKQLLRTEHTEINQQISPDGGYMAYASDESGQMEVYVRSFPDMDAGKWQVSTNGGESPLWSPDGKELFYIVEGAYMAVPVEMEPIFKPGNPEVLFRGGYIAGFGEGTPWDIHPDGKRFLMMKQAGTPASAEAASQPKIVIVTNWFEELKQRVPVE
jgi:Tol biopolymer transport system component